MRLISPRLFRLPGRILPVYLAIPIALGALAGCRSNNSKDRLETNLRQREKEIALLREDIDRIAGYNLALQTEVRSMRGQPGPSACDPFTPLYPVRSIVVGRTSTALDDDGKPGDDAVQIVLETRDADGKLFRAPGKVQMQMLEVSPEGLKNLIGTYQFGPDEMRPLWKQGLLTSGYVFNLPWQTPPRQDKIRVVAQFTMEDGRQFEAERELRVKPPSNPSLQIVPDGPNSGPILFPGVGGLPPGTTIIGPAPSATGELMPGLVPTPGSPSPFPESSTLPFPKTAPSQPASGPAKPGSVAVPETKTPASPAPSPVPSPMPGARSPGTLPAPAPVPTDPKKGGTSMAPMLGKPAPVVTLLNPRPLPDRLEDK